MDKIYSRKRFLIPKIKKTRNIYYRKFKINGEGNGNSKNSLDNSLINKNKNNVNLKRLRKLLKVLAIVSIAICVADRVLLSIRPIISTLSRDMAKSIAIKISNEQATKAMR